MGDINTRLSYLNRSAKLNTSKETVVIKFAMDGFDLTEMCRYFTRQIGKIHFFSGTHVAFMADHPSIAYSLLLDQLRVFLLINILFQRGATQERLIDTLIYRVQW